MAFLKITCPYCAQRIPLSSNRCPECRSLLPVECGQEEVRRIFFYVKVISIILFLTLVLLIIDFVFV